MDRLRDFDGERDWDASDTRMPADDAAIEPPPSIGRDERRMQVRAYNHWVALLEGRSLPSAEDFEIEANDDFGSNSVLLDFTQGAGDPAIAFLGDKLCAECRFDEAPATIADVPPRSLLSRLTDHYLQIIANRAPIGFEAEFVNEAGFNTAYRGILLPFSSDDDTIDFICGVINWKDVAPAAEAEALHAEVAAALAHPAMPRSAAPIWADGPNGPREAAAPAVPALPSEDEGLADWLAAARASADLAVSADGRSRATLYDALGLAFDFAALADERGGEYARLLADSGMKVQARAPMTPIVKLVFGVDYDKTRLTEFAAALSFGRRRGLPRGGMRVFLDHYPGGLKAIVAAERRERRPASAPPKPDKARDAARALEAQAVLTLPGDDEFVVLVARRIDAERVAVIGVAPDNRALLDRALKAII